MFMMQDNGEGSLIDPKQDIESEGSESDDVTMRKQDISPLDNSVGLL